MASVEWVKLTTDMFDNRKIKHLRRLPDGNSIVLIWVMLLTMAGRCNAGGMIFLTENIPYTPKMLADELDFEESTVVLALNSLRQLNMIVVDNDYFAIAGWEEYQNIEGLDRIREQNRLRKQKQRETQKLVSDMSRDMSRDVTLDVTLCHATEREEDKDIKNIDNKKETTHTLFKRLACDYLFSLPEHAALEAKMEEWVKYKMERKEPYKEQGMKSLLRQVENNAFTYGDQAVCDLIDDSMANGWKGIIFDRLKQKQNNRQYGKKEKLPGWEYNPDKYLANDSFIETAKRMLAEEPQTAVNDPAIAERAELLRKQLQE